MDIEIAMAKHTFNISMTQSPFTELRRIFTVDSSAPAGVTWAYGLANIFQVAPGEAALMLNLRRAGVTAGDLEAGNDIVVFDDPAALNKARRFQLNRGGPFVREDDGRAFELSMGCSIGGFMPLGALGADGCPHPGAGTGFCIAAVVGYNPHLQDRPRDVVAGPNPYFRQLFQQIRYDGQSMSIVDSATIDMTDLVDGYSLRPGFKFGLVDGDDILFPLFGHRIDSSPEVAAGDRIPGHWRQQGGRIVAISRWRYVDACWQIVDFSPIEGMEGYFEPTMVRDIDGSLLLTARGLNSTPQKNSIEVWRSVDAGKSWEKVIDQPGLRGSNPVSIGINANGQAFVLGCKFDPATNGSSRHHLCLWPLADDRRSLGDPLTIKDSAADFGLLDGEFPWWIDHPLAEVVTLSDGQPRCLLTCRVVNELEVARDLPPTEHTGMWLAIGSPAALPHQA